MTWDRGMAAVLALVCAVPAALGQGMGQGSGQGSGQGRSHSAGVVMKEASYLGIGVEDVNDERARGLKLKDDRGAYITSVMPGTPAAKAGIQVGDVILEFNGQRVEDKDQLIRMVRETPAGKQAKISLWRNGAPMMVVATVAAHKMMESDDGNWSFEMSDLSNLAALPGGINMPLIEIPKMITVMQNPALGIEGESLQAQLAEYFGVKDGVLVKSVARNSPAERAGIKAGDVIARIGDTRIATWRDVSAAMRYAQAGRPLNVAVVRNRKDLGLTLALEER
jgi:serine protease Do